MNVHITRVAITVNQHASSHSQCELHANSTFRTQGVCAGLREVLEAATRHQLAEHLPEILPPIQAALCDGDAAVREAAGAAFGVLFRGGAHSAVDGVVPSLLAGLDSEAHYAASVEGLRVILGVRPTTFNGVAPKLLRPPVTSAALRALGELAGVAGGWQGDCGFVCLLLCRCKRPRAGLELSTCDETLITATIPGTPLWCPLQTHSRNSLMCPGSLSLVALLPLCHVCRLHGCCFNVIVVWHVPLIAAAVDEQHL